MCEPQQLFQKLSWVSQSFAQWQFAAQAGVWDVDGTGMWAIEDPEVDLGIRKVHSSISLCSSRACSAVCPPHAVPAQPHCSAGCVLWEQSPEPPQASPLCVLVNPCICISGLNCFRRYRLCSREGHNGNLVGYSWICNNWGSGLTERECAGAESDWLRLQGSNSHAVCDGAIHPVALLSSLEQQDERNLRWQWGASVGAQAHDCWPETGNPP